MTRLADSLRELHPTEDKVNLCNDTLIGVDGYWSLTAAFSTKEGGVTVRLVKVTYAPDMLSTNFPYIMAARKRRVGFATDNGGVSVTLADGRLRVWSDGCGYSTFGGEIDADGDYTPLIGRV